MSETPQRWAGERLGLPENGRGSLAKMPRRIAAIFIDWGSALLISHAFFKDGSWETLLTFSALQFTFILVIGASIGHWLCGLRLIRKTPGTGIGVYQALARVVLLALVIPVAVWDADGRGLHDKAADTILVRR